MSRCIGSRDRLGSEVACTTRGLNDADGDDGGDSSRRLGAAALEGGLLGTTVGSLRRLTIRDLGAAVEGFRKLTICALAAWIGKGADAEDGALEAMALAMSLSDVRKQGGWWVRGWLAAGNACIGV